MCFSITSKGNTTDLLPFGLFWVGSLPNEASGEISLFVFFAYLRWEAKSQHQVFCDPNQLGNSRFPCPRAGSEGYQAKCCRLFAPRSSQREVLFPALHGAMVLCPRVGKGKMLLPVQLASQSHMEKAFTVCSSVPNYRNLLILKDWNMVFTKVHSDLSKLFFYYVACFETPSSILPWGIP